MVMSSIQKILSTDKFQDLVDKINEVINYCDGSLKQSVNDAFKSIGKIETIMAESGIDLENDAVVTEEQMKEYIEQLYS